MGTFRSKGECYPPHEANVKLNRLSRAIFLCDAIVSNSGQAESPPFKVTQESFGAPLLNR
jgi:hypothetical protein